MIIYTESSDGINPADLQGFFVGWPNPPSPEVHLKLIAGSDHVVLAKDDESGRVIGFITAITDGVLSAYIPLLEVLPEFQGRGIGQELAKRMIHKLNTLYMVDLLCDVNVQPFYEALGLQKAHGMCLRNYARQSGADTNV